MLDMDSVTELKHNVKIEEFSTIHILRENDFGDRRTLQFLHIFRILILKDFKLKNLRISTLWVGQPFLNICCKKSLACLS